MFYLTKQITFVLDENDFVLADFVRDWPVTFTNYLKLLSSDAYQSL